MSTKNPTELIDRYLQAVRFWLPKSRRREGLLTELGEDLRSQVEDKETTLGRPLDENEVAEILKRCGAPMIVAGNLGPRRGLIGPTLYPIYAFVMRMVLLWILAPVFLFIIGPVNLANGGWGPAIAATISQLWSGLFIAGGIITLAFAIIERATPLRDLNNMHAGLDAKWDPRKLPPLRRDEQRDSPMKLFCKTMFASIGLVWLLLLPHYPALILGGAASFLKAAPIWHGLYLPIVCLGVLNVLRPAITMSKPGWTGFPIMADLVQTVLALTLVNALVNAAHITTGGWQPFLVVAKGADAARYAQATAIVNLSILICIVCTWFGLCIAGIVATWQLVKYLRQRLASSRQTLTLA